MILIADSGSTKAEWVVVQDGMVKDSLFTKGINPYHSTPAEIASVITEGLQSVSVIRFTDIYFYGTGCNTTAKEDIIRGELARVLNAGSIFVGTDLLGAARALCKDKPGIACILGTGSNSCYYNGSEIRNNVPPLGYILGDEGSAASMGRRLVADILRGILPGEIVRLFFETYKTSQAEILENVYRQPFPSRYLGQFTRFLSSNMEVPEIRGIVTVSVDDFIRRNIMLYPEAKDYAIHFTGSIAWHFREVVEERLKNFGMAPGIITAAPMPELVRYHNNNSYSSER